MDAFKLNMHHHTPVGALVERIRLQASINIADGRIPFLEASVYRLESRIRPTAKDIRTGSYDGTLAIS